MVWRPSMVYLGKNHSREVNFVAANGIIRRLGPTDLNEGVSEHMF